MSSQNPEGQRPKHSPISRRAFLRNAARGAMGVAGATYIGLTGCYPDALYGYSNGGWTPYVNYSDNVGYYNDEYGNYNDSLYMDYVNGGYADYAAYDDYPNFTE